VGCGHITEMINASIAIPIQQDYNDKTVGGSRKVRLSRLTAGSGIGKSQFARELAHSLIKSG
jgi:hypothetical protein